MRSLYKSLISKKLVENNLQHGIFVKTAQIKPYSNDMYILRS
jgi:hypothetical protein